MAAHSDPAAAASAAERWPGWPGDNVFRMIVPLLKVGAIIGPKGELVKKICQETRAAVRVLNGAIGTDDRIVLISGREEPEAAISPAMDATLRVFKRVHGISENESGPAICSARFLVPIQQAFTLIGKQGTTIKPIQESTGTLIQIISGAKLPIYASAEERIVDVQGESPKVLKALEAILGHLRKYLVDHSVVKLFEKSSTAPVAQDRLTDTWDDKAQALISTAQPGSDTERSFPPKRETSFLDRETFLLDSQIPRTGLSLYGEDPGYSGLNSSGAGRTVDAFVTQNHGLTLLVTKIMQIPLSYAKAVIGSGGHNIDHIRRKSGSLVTVQETRVPDELTVEIKGSETQVQVAHKLIEEFITGQKKESSARNYTGLDTDFRSTYSDCLAYLSSLTGPSFSGNGYSRYRL